MSTRTHTCQRIRMCTNGNAWGVVGSLSIKYPHMMRADGTRKAFGARVRIAESREQLPDADTAAL